MPASYPLSSECDLCAYDDTSVLRRRLRHNQEHVEAIGNDMNLCIHAHVLGIIICMYAILSGYSATVQKHAKFKTDYKIIEYFHQ